jgi:hypothetical protein
MPPDWDTHVHDDGNTCRQAAASTFFIPVSSKCSEASPLLLIGWIILDLLPAEDNEDTCRSDFGSPKPFADDPKMTTRVPGRRAFLNTSLFAHESIHAAAQRGPLQQS